MTVDLAAPHASPFGEAMDRTVSSAETPNGGISGQILGWYVPRITFHHGYARRAGDAKVAADLAELARLLFRDRMLRWRRVMAEHGLSQPRLLTGHREEWRQARDTMAVTGASSDGSMTVLSSGLLEWSVSVRPGTVDELDDVDLGRAATEAATRMIESWVEGLSRLNREMLR